MSYGVPADPVAATVITVAYAVTNLLNPIRALRAFTGGSDPPGSGYVVTSDSVSAASWKSMVAQVMAAIGYTPANRAGDTFTGPVAVNAGLTAASVSAGGNIQALINLIAANSGSQGGALIVHAPSNTRQWVVAPDTARLAIYNTTAGGVGLSLPNALSGAPTWNGHPLAFLDGAAFTQPISAPSATVNGALSSRNNLTVFNDGAQPGAVRAVAPNGTSYSEFRDDGSSVVIATNSGGILFFPRNGSGALVCNGNAYWHTGNMGPGSTMNADLLDGMHAADIIAAAASGGVPSGVIAAVRTAAAIPTGWTRFTDGDGRVLIGAAASAVGGVTFTENTAVGTTWLHTHTQAVHTHSMQSHVHGMSGHTHDLQNHTHSAASLGVGGSTGTSAQTDGLGNGGGTSVNTTNHTHTAGSLDVTGSTDGPSPNTTGGNSNNTDGPSSVDTGNSSNDTVNAVSGIPVMGRVVVHIIKS